jgi:hypothetical protein
VEFRRHRARLVLHLGPDRPVGSKLGKEFDLASPSVQEDVDFALLKGKWFG